MSDSDTGVAAVVAESATTVASAATNPEAANPNITPGTDPAAVEGQGQGNTAEGEPEADKAADKSEGAPESYAEFTVPEGFTLDGERLEFAQAKFKELNLSQDKAQALVEAFCKADAENAATRAQVLEEATQQRREAWASEAREQMGVKYDENVTLARAAVAAVNSPALLEAFNAEGWGNHPEMIRAFAFFGAQIRGSGLKGLGGESAAVDRSAIPIEKRLYPNMN